MDLTLYRHNVWVLQYQFDKLIMGRTLGGPCVLGIYIVGIVGIVGIYIVGLSGLFRGFQGFSSPCDDGDFGPLMIEARREGSAGVQAAA